MLLVNCLIPDLNAMRFIPGHISIRGDIIESILTEIPSKHSGPAIDCKGMYICPGLCDGHVHIESSRLSPDAFMREAVAAGTVYVFADPHEIANVIGRKGVEFFLEQAAAAPLDLYVGIPSCVPATHLETAGGEITLKDIQELLTHDNIYGLAEMMNFPGIIHDIGDARAKVQAALDAGRIVDGHCPGLSGKDLKAYISNGKNDNTVRIMSDHECTSYKEAREKHDLGMHIMLRYGSAAKDLPALLKGFAQNGIFSDRLILACDDITASDLRKYGHINHLQMKAREILETSGGLDRETAFLHALKMCTKNTLSYFKVKGGEISEGNPATLIIHPSLDLIEPETVIRKGTVVYEHGSLTDPQTEQDYTPYFTNLYVPPDIDIKVRSENDSPLCRIIERFPDSIVTGAAEDTLETRNGEILPDPDKGIAKLCVIERHKGSGNRGVGFVKGFMFTKGAVASTVAHDSHNIIAAGYDDELILKAVKLLRTSGGGMAAVTYEKECVFPLQICGLMSTCTTEHVIKQETKLEECALTLGFNKDVFSSLSFLALPVIPELKLTDLGLVDVTSFQVVPLEIM
jgi:adenine deaminase